MKNALVKSRAAPRSEGYGAILLEMVGILEAARGKAAWCLNSVITSTYWLIGQRIVVHEQEGASKAEYGERLVDRLAQDLTARFGRGFSRRNLFQMRKFYLLNPEIVQTRSAQFRTVASGKKVQTPSAQSGLLGPDVPVFPLPWSHYVRLLWVSDPAARTFYEQEALKGGWTFRQRRARTKRAKS